MRTREGKSTQNLSAHQELRRLNILSDWRYPGSQNFVPCVMPSCLYSNPGSLCRPATLPCPVVSNVHPVVLHSDHCTWGAIWADNFRGWMIITPSEQMCSDLGRLCDCWSAGGMTFFFLILFLAWIFPFVVSDDCSQALSLDSAPCVDISYQLLPFWPRECRFARETHTVCACSLLSGFISFQSCLEIHNHHVSYVVVYISRGWRDGSEVKRKLVAFPEDPSSNASTHIRWLTNSCNSCSRGIFFF